MKIWTTHEKPHAPPLLVREGFSFGALLFGPVWLAACRAWIPAGVTLLLDVLILTLAGQGIGSLLIAVFALLLGFSGRDLVRWSLAQSGYAQTHVIASRNEDEARLRLFTARPDLVNRTMVAEAAL